MKSLKNIAVCIALFAGASSAMAGASSAASAAQAADLGLSVSVDNDAGSCEKRTACIRLNRYAIKSTLLVRQLLVQNGIVAPRTQ